jgi:hypothetical protein
MNTAIPLKDRILAEVAETPSPTRAQGRRRSGGLVAVSVALGLAAFQMLGGLAPTSERPLVYTVRLADGWALASCLVTWLVLRQSAPRVSSRRCLQAVALASPLALWMWACFFHAQVVEPPEPCLWRCVVQMVLTSGVPLAAFLLVRSGREPDHGGVVGAAMATACASWAGVATFLRCPSTEPLHVLVGHALPIVAMAVCGYAIGTRKLVVRRLSPVPRTAR